MAYTTKSTDFEKYYQILGVSAGCSEEDLKASYRKLAMKHHPDKIHNDPNSSSKFQEISHAYKRLTTPGNGDSDDSHTFSAAHFADFFRNMFSSGYRTHFVHPEDFHSHGHYHGHGHTCGHHQFYDFNDSDEDLDEYYSDSEDYYTESDDDGDEELPKLPQAPVLKTSFVTNISIGLVWNEPKSLTPIVNYVLEIGNDSGGVPKCDYTQIYKGKDLSFEAKDLQPRTTYHFIVKAINAAGSGHYSRMNTAITVGVKLPKNDDRKGRNKEAKKEKPPQGARKQNGKENQQNQQQPRPKSKKSKSGKQDEVQPEAQVEAEEPDSNAPQNQHKKSNKKKSSNQETPGTTSEPVKSNSKKPHKKENIEQDVDEHDVDEVHTVHEQPKKMDKQKPQKQNQQPQKQPQEASNQKTRPTEAPSTPQKSKQPKKQKQSSSQQPPAEELQTDTAPLPQKKKKEKVLPDLGKQEKSQPEETELPVQKKKNKKKAQKQAQEQPADVADPLDELVHMGFEVGQARAALAINPSLESAVEHLLKKQTESQHLKKQSAPSPGFTEVHSKRGVSQDAEKRTQPASLKVPPPPPMPAKTSPPPPTKSVSASAKTLPAHVQALPPNVTKSASPSLWVGNVSENVSEEQIRKLFDPYGQISSVRILPQTHCAFVNYTTMNAAQQAILGLQNAVLDNMCLRINFTKDHKSTAPPQQHSHHQQLPPRLRKQNAPSMNPPYVIPPSQIQQPAQPHNQTINQTYISPPSQTQTKSQNQLYSHPSVQNQPHPQIQTPIQPHSQTPLATQVHIQPQSKSVGPMNDILPPSNYNKTQLHALQANSSNVQPKQNSIQQPAPIQPPLLPQQQPHPQPQPELHHIALPLQPPVYSPIMLLQPQFDEYVHPNHEYSSHSQPSSTRQEVTSPNIDFTPLSMLHPLQQEYEHEQESYANYLPYPSYQQLPSPGIQQFQQPQHPQQQQQQQQQQQPQQSQAYSHFSSDFTISPPPYQPHQLYNFTNYPSFFPPSTNSHSFYQQQPLRQVYQDRPAWPNNPI